MVLRQDKNALSVDFRSSAHKWERVDIVVFMLEEGCAGKNLLLAVARQGIPKLYHSEDSHNKFYGIETVERMVDLLHSTCLRLGSMQSREILLAQPKHYQNPTSRELLSRTHGLAFVVPGDPRE